MAEENDINNPIEIDDDEEEVKWLKYYSSKHQILLVGDGDFSFSLSLANCFGSASNIVATSRDLHENVVDMYSNGKSNLENLKKLGATIIHEVDATNMKMHTELRRREFDRIIFNFPHAGFFGKEDNQDLIGMHMILVQGFFSNASGMLSPDGEVHVNHKTTAPFNNWGIEELATGYCLKLTECIEFKEKDYPGYSNKRGAGARCDKPFPLRECSTFKFRIVPGLEKKAVPGLKKKAVLGFKLKAVPGFKKKAPKVIPAIVNTEVSVPDMRIQIPYPGSFNVGFPQAIPFGNIPPNISTTMGLPPINNSTPNCFWIFREYFEHADIMFCRGGYDVRRVTYETLDAGFNRYMMGNTKRDSNDFIIHLKELHRMSQLKLKRLQGLLSQKADKQKDSIGI